MTIHGKYDPDTDTFSTFLRADDVPVSYGDGYEAYTPIGVHGRFRFGKVRRHDRWWLAKSLVGDSAPGDIARLRKEFDIGVSLDSPYIARVIDFADIPDVGPAIIMEWVSGCTLSLWLESKPGRRAVRRVYSQLLDAIEYMHRNGVVHGDIKPGNIMITSSGDVKLIDFGLGDAEWSALTAPGGGSRGYSAPEQMQGHAPTRASDIFALGAVLDYLRPYLGMWRRLTLRRTARRAMRLSPQERPADVETFRKKITRAPRRWAYGAALFVAICAFVPLFTQLRQMEEKPAATSATPVASETSPQKVEPKPTSETTHIVSDIPTTSIPIPGSSEEASTIKESQPDVEKKLAAIRDNFNRKVDDLWLAGWNDAKYHQLVRNFRRELKAYLPTAPQYRRPIDSLMNDPMALHTGMLYLAHNSYEHLDSTVHDPRLRQNIKFEHNYLHTLEHYGNQFRAR